MGARRLEQWIPSEKDIFEAGSLSSIGGPADGSHLGQAVTSQQWEKPEELTILEHQHQQKPLAQQHQAQSHAQVPYAQQVRQTQPVQLQAQLQTKLHNHQQLRQPTFSSLCQASGVTGHQNVQGLQASQEWMWETN